MLSYSIMILLFRQSEMLMQLCYLQCLLCDLTFQLLRLFIIGLMVKCVPLEARPKD